LTVAELEKEWVNIEAARMIHVAGYFVLPGLRDPEFAGFLKKAQEQKIYTSLDVVQSPQMSEPEPLWLCLPYLNLFLCNRQEAEQMLGEPDPVDAARLFREKGARAVVVKLGDQGVWLDSERYTGNIPARRVPIVDTTGAGDAFTAGTIAGLLAGDSLEIACERGNQAGARIVGKLGAVAAWFE
jgi:sugar/nucleoside kinase (ribokinase family)